MSSSVMEELQGLRKMMEPRRQLVSSPSGKSSNLIRGYSEALTTAEHSVDRLSRAMEAAEEEMEIAIQRTGEVQKSQVARKEVEVNELRRVVAAKEKSIDGLRETLAATKRNLEARIQRLESTIAARDMEVRQLQEHNASVKVDRDSLQHQLQHELSQNNLTEKEHQQRVHNMASALQAAREEHLQMTESLKQERKENDKLVQKVEDLRTQLKAAKQNLKAEVERRHGLHQAFEKERRELMSAGKDEEILKLKQQLQQEKDNFKKSKQWLKAELKAREDMETLLIALREIATAPYCKDSFRKGTHCVEEQIEAITPHGSDDDARYPYDIKQIKKDFKTRQTLLNKDGRRLRAELDATKKMLTRALTCGDKAKGSHTVS